MIVMAKRQQSTLAVGGLGYVAKVIVIDLLEGV